MEKPDWIIHYVQEHYCQCCGKHEENHVGFPRFANAHTHGLEKHGHDEICIPFDIGPKPTLGLLNEIGLRIREAGEKFEVGCSTDILEDKRRVELYRSNGSKTLYILLPDPNGLLPGEDGCMEPYSFQRTYADIIEEENTET